MHGRAKLHRATAAREREQRRAVHLPRLQRRGRASRPPHHPLHRVLIHSAFSDRGLVRRLPAPLFARGLRRGQFDRFKPTRLSFVPNFPQHFVQEPWKIPRRGLRANVSSDHIHRPLRTRQRHVEQTQALISRVRFARRQMRREDGVMLHK